MTTESPLATYPNNHDDIKAHISRAIDADPVRPVEWLYSQSTGRLMHGQPDNAKETPAYIGSGYAGQNEGLNNPEYQSVEGIDGDSNGGPLPQGRYTIGAQQDNVTSDGRKMLKGSMRLTPDPANIMFDRKGFLIHGDNSKNNHSASEGCIILNPGIRNLIGKSGHNVLRVIP
jgi:hypothetical protein